MDRTSGQDEVQILGDDYISFGSMSDLDIGENFEVCSCNLEQSFGCGLNPGSKPCTMLLAGRENFSIDSLEVFEINLPTNGSTLARRGVFK